MRPTVPPLFTPAAAPTDGTSHGAVETDNEQADPIMIDRVGSREPTRTPPKSAATKIEQRQRQNRTTDREDHSLGAFVLPPHVKQALQPQMRINCECCRVC